MICPPLFRSFFTLAILMPPAFAGELRVGSAAAVINPPPGTPLAGYYGMRASAGVLDDIFAKALVFEQDGAKAAVVVCDLISLPRHIVVDARALIVKQTGIADVLLAATHTHTAPVLTRESSMDELVGGTTELSRSYTAQLPAMIAQAVADANARLAPARAFAAKGRVENLAYNRRFWMEDGTVSWNPPKLDPRIVAPAGPHDPEVGVLYFAGADPATAKEIACFVNYAMHPDTTGGLKISADYQGVVSRRLAEMKSPALVTLVANGTCGNINHRNVWWADRQGGPGETARLGNILAGAVSEAWPRLAEIKTTPVRARREIVKLALPDITEADRAAARETARRAGSAKFMDQVQTFRVLDVLARGGQPWEVEVQVIALGDDVAFVSLPGEVFVELGLAIKAASPFKHTQIIELANGSIGYIPDRSAYAEGNYEVISARCAAGSGEQLVEAAVRMLKELKP